MPIDRLAPVFSDFTVHTPKLRDVRLSIGVELRYNSGVSEKDRAQAYATAVNLPDSDFAKSREWAGHITMKGLMKA